MDSFLPYILHADITTSEEWWHWANKHSKFIGTALQTAEVKDRIANALTFGAVGFSNCNDSHYIHRYLGLKEGDDEKWEAPDAIITDWYRPPIMVRAMSASYGGKDYNLKAEFYMSARPPNGRRITSPNVAHGVYYNQLTLKKDAPSWLTRRIEKVVTKNYDNVIHRIKLLGTQSKPQFEVTSGSSGGYGIALGVERTYGDQTSIPPQHLPAMVTYFSRMLRPVAEEMVIRGLYEFPAHA